MRADRHAGALRGIRSKAFFDYLALVDGEEVGGKGEVRPSSQPAGEHQGDVLGLVGET